MKKLVLLSSAAVALAACTTVSSPSEAQSSSRATSISAADKKQGAEAHPQLLQEFGGSYGGNQSSYVVGVGQNIAVQSGLSNARGDFTVTLLNSPVNNAFAIPGGYVYVTRQLMGLMNDEAELAGVLGHEVGHVAARHSKKRQSAATRNSILGVLGTVLGGVIGDSGGLLGGLGGLLQNNSMQMAQMATLGFSRSQELEADDLGVRYLRSAGYDTRALSTMLASLANQTALESRVWGQNARSVPEWASTHPDPASRVTRAASVAQKAGGTNGRRNREQFLAALDGVMYDDDPRQGVIEGRSFLHPEMRLGFTIPQGFAMQNGTQAVTVSGNGGQAMFTTAQYNGNMETYVNNALQQIVGKAQYQLGQLNRTTVNGLPAYYRTARASTQSGQVDVTIFAYEFAKDRAYHFATMAKAGQSQAFNPMFQSVRRLTANEASAIKPRRIDVVTVGRGDTVSRIASRMAYSNYKEERFRVLNGLSANSSLTPGQKVKIITY